MAGFSYKNKKFPLKAVPTILVTVLTSFTVTIGINILLQDNPDFLDLSLFESEEIKYEFQTILETNNFEDLESVEQKLSNSANTMLNLVVLELKKLHKVRSTNLET